MKNSNLLGVKKTLHRFVALACLLVAPTASAQVLSAGGLHTCAIDVGGEVRCWGWNDYGQLGDGSTKTRMLPVRVKNLGSGVVAVAAAYLHTCALRANGEVLCWGGNEYGELGDGTTISRRVPTRVEGLGPGSGVTAIALGGSHACALKSSGAVLCWGSDEFGQIGDGSSRGTRPLTPVLGLGPGSGVMAIAAGGEHTCAVKSDQSMYCWGFNSGGQLGDGTTISRNVNVAVRTLNAGSGVVSVSAGSGHTCAGRNDGAVLCWGWNKNGQLGDGTRSNRWVPGNVLGAGSGKGRVSAGDEHSCALAAHGVACWGSNGSGQIGDNSHVDRLLPTSVSMLDTDIDAIAVGYTHSCARKIDGVVVCWGNNNTGQLGNGSDITMSTPQVVLLDEIVFSDGFE